MYVGGVSTIDGSEICRLRGVDGVEGVVGFGVLAIAVRQRRYSVKAQRRSVLAFDAPPLLAAGAMAGALVVELARGKLGAKTVCCG